MLKRLRCVSAALLAFAGPSSARGQNARWVDVASGKVVQVAADTSRLRYDGDTADVWLQYRYTRDQRPAGTTRPLRSSVSHDRVACTTMRSVTLANYGYASDGSVVLSLDYPGSWSDVVAGSVGEAEARELCQRRRRYDGTYAREWDAYIESSKRYESLVDGWCAETQEPSELAVCTKRLRLKRAVRETKATQGRSAAIARFLVYRATIDSVFHTEAPTMPAIP